MLVESPGREQLAVPVYGVVPVAATVQIFPAGTYHRCRGTDHCGVWVVYGWLGAEALVCFHDSYTNCVHAWVDSGSNFAF